MRKLATPLLLLIASLAYGQQEIQFTQFMHNKLYYNPGATGAAGSICITGVHRSQWVGFDNAPVTQNLNAEVPLDILHGGVGINIVNDQIGFFQDVTAGISYAFQMPLGDGTLGLGAQADFRNKSVNGAEWITPDGTLEASIPANNTSNMSIDVNFGAYYQTEKYWAGISSTRLLQAEAELVGSSLGGVSRFKGQRNYIFMGGYNYDIENTNITLMPAVLVKSDLVKTSADIHLGATYNNKIWGGVSYRLSDALGLMAGYYITPDFKITYSYDITLSDLSTVSSGSHEILLGYCFNIEIAEKEPGYYRSPRFL